MILYSEVTLVWSWLSVLLNCWIIWAGGSCELMCGFRFSLRLGKTCYFWSFSVDLLSFIVPYGRKEHCCLEASRALSCSREVTCAAKHSLHPELTHKNTQRMVWVGRELWRSSHPTPVLKQVHLEQAAQDQVQVGFKYLQRRRLHSPSGPCLPLRSVIISSLLASPSTCKSVGDGLEPKIQKLIIKRGRKSPKN